MQVVQAKCPNCGAGLKVDPGADQATCAYCGTTSFVQRRSMFLQRPLPLPAAARGTPAARIAQQRVSGVMKLLVTLPFLGALAGIAAPIGVCVYRSKLTTGLHDSMRWRGAGPALLVDVDGDGTDDAIGMVRYVHDGDRVNLAAFSGTNGHRLWQTENLATYSDAISTRAVLAGTTVLWADNRGSLRGFARSTGAAMWTASLGEVVKAICRATSDSQIDVMTADERWQRVALADGASVPIPKRSPEQCDALPSDDQDALAGLVVIDRSRRDMPVIEGMRIARLVERPNGPRLAIGTRSPGTAVPMVAVLDAAGSLRWKAEVPARDPLTAETSPPEWFALGTDDVVVIYERGNQEPPLLTSFDVRTGTRRWEVPIAKGTTIVMRGVSLSRDSVFVSSWGHLQAFDRATGGKRFIVGAL